MAVTIGEIIIAWRELREVASGVVSSSTDAGELSRRWGALCRIMDRLTDQEVGNDFCDGEEDAGDRILQYESLHRLVRHIESRVVTLEGKAC